MRFFHNLDYISWQVAGMYRWWCTWSTFTWSCYSAGVPLWLECWVLISLDGCILVGSREWSKTVNHLIPLHFFFTLQGIQDIMTFFMRKINAILCHLFIWGLILISKHSLRLQHNFSDWQMHLFYWLNIGKGSLFWGFIEVRPVLRLLLSLPSFRHSM